MLKGHLCKPSASLALSAKRETYLEDLLNRLSDFLSNSITRDKRNRVDTTVLGRRLQIVMTPNARVGQPGFHRVRRRIWTDLGARPRDSNAEGSRQARLADLRRRKYGERLSISGKHA
jgi:hypothetical protein